jgi:AAA+ ATPase superfamily predicted ATPase
MWRNMTESSFVAGRAPEQVELAHALKSGRPELIAVYGRRRVGKTYLIRGFFVEKICLEVTGARGASLKDQLANFVRVLETRVPYPLAVPASWADAFDMLKRYFAELLANGERRVVFLDELPWLASPRSGFLSARDGYPKIARTCLLG